MNTISPKSEEIICHWIELDDDDNFTAEVRITLTLPDGRVIGTVVEVPMYIEE